jgi:hypothetical protein
MSVAAVLLPVAHLVTAGGDKPPEDNDVVAGGGGALVFVLLLLAVVVLGFSLVKQLRKAQAAKDAGLYGDEPVDPAKPSENSDSESR